MLLAVVNGDDERDAHRMAQTTLKRAIDDFRAWLTEHPSEGVDVKAAVDDAELALRWKRDDSRGDAELLEWDDVDLDDFTMWCVQKLVATPRGRTLLRSLAVFFGYLDEPELAEDALDQEEEWLKAIADPTLFSPGKAALYRGR